MLNSWWQKKKRRKTRWKNKTASTFHLHEAGKRWTPLSGTSLGRLAAEPSLAQLGNVSSRKCASEFRVERCEVFPLKTTGLARMGANEAGLGAAHRGARRGRGHGICAVQQD
jgi:hypothetical protein